MASIGKKIIYIFGALAFKIFKLKNRLIPDGTYILIYEVEQIGKL